MLKDRLKTALRPLLAARYGSSVIRTLLLS